MAGPPGRRSGARGQRLRRCRHPSRVGCRGACRRGRGRGPASPDARCDRRTVRAASRNRHDPGGAGWLRCRAGDRVTGVRPRSPPGRLGFGWRYPDLGRHRARVALARQGGQSRGVDRCHGHQRQDNHGATGQPSPGRRWPSCRACRQYRCPRARCDPRPAGLRCHRGRAVEFPAALDAAHRRRGDRTSRQRLPQPRRRPSRLARFA